MLFNSFYVFPFAKGDVLLLHFLLQLFFNLVAVGFVNENNVVCNEILCNCRLFCAFVFESPAGGASGIGFAFMGFLGVLALLRGGNLMTSGIGQLLLLNVVITLAVPNIAIGGHVGGLVAGALAGLVVEIAPKSDIPGWVRTAGLYALAVFMMGAALLVAQNVN